MTEQVIAFVVVLEDTVSFEDAEAVKDLLSLIKNVSSVRPVGKDMMTEIAKDRARTEIREDILRVLNGRTR